LEIKLIKQFSFVLGETTTSKTLKGPRAGGVSGVVNKPLTQLVQRNKYSFISLLYALKTSSIKFL